MEEGNKKINISRIALLPKGAQSGKTQPAGAKAVAESFYGSNGDMDGKGPTNKANRNSGREKAQGVLKKHSARGKLSNRKWSWLGEKNGTGRILHKGNQPSGSQTPGGEKKVSEESWWRGVPQERGRKKQIKVAQQAKMVQVKPVDKSFPLT